MSSNAKVMSSNTKTIEDVVEDNTNELNSQPLSPHGLQSDDHVIDDVGDGVKKYKSTLTLEQMLELPPDIRLKHWQVYPPKQGYAYIDENKVARNPWFFGIHFEVNRIFVLIFGIIVQLCCGTLYAFSVFNDPINKSGEGVRQNWSNPGLVYGLSVFCFGMAASVTGTLLEMYGPRFTGTMSAIFWGTGHFLSAIAIEYDLEFLFYLGFGVVGGIGLAFGYVTPVSPMVKWWPDKRGLAAGSAVMGFGLGAVIAAYLNSALIDSVGVVDTFWILGVIYLIMILLSSQYLCKPPTAWTPEGFEYEVQANKIREGHSLTTKQAMKTPHFWLVWIVLFCCIISGVSVLSQAKPIQKDVFERSGETADIILSIWATFNCTGRLFYAMCSDLLSARGLSRKYMYMIYCLVQACLVISFPFITKSKDLFPLFAASVCIVISMMGGTFSVLPAFLADQFGQQNVGAIHGVTLTAWGFAGGIGSLLIAQIKEKRKDDGVPDNELYDPFFYVGFTFLCVGFVAAALLRPLIDKRGNLRMNLGWIDTWKRKWKRRQLRKQENNNNNNNQNINQNDIELRMDKK